MADERFPRRRRVRSAQDFARARKRGRQVSGPLLVLTYARIPAPQHPRRSATELGTVAGVTASAIQSPDIGAPEVGEQPRELPPSRIGFSVGKRVGDAVTRNLVKRRLREISRRCLGEIAPGWDIIIGARTPSARATYNTLDTEVRTLLSRARLSRTPPEHP